MKQHLSILVEGVVGKKELVLFVAKSLQETKKSIPYLGEKVKQYNVLDTQIEPVENLERFIADRLMYSNSCFTFSLNIELFVCSKASLILIHYYPEDFSIEFLRQVFVGECKSVSFPANVDFLGGLSSLWQVTSSYFFSNSWDLEDHSFTRQRQSSSFLLKQSPFLLPVFNNQQYQKFQQTLGIDTDDFLLTCLSGALQAYVFSQEKSPLYNISCFLDLPHLHQRFDLPFEGHRISRLHDIQWRKNKQRQTEVLFPSAMQNVKKVRASMYYKRIEWPSDMFLNRFPIQRMNMFLPYCVEGQFYLSLGAISRPSGQCDTSLFIPSSSIENPILFCSIFKTEQESLLRTLSSGVST